MAISRKRIIKKEFSHKYYSKSSIWAENYWSQVQMERASHTVSLLPNSIQSILEIGCGAGIVTKELMNRFPFVIGLDFFIIPLLQVKNEKIHVIQGDAGALPFPDKAFDAIVAAELLEHLEDKERQQVLF